MNSLGTNWLERFLICKLNSRKTSISCQIKLTRNFCKAIVLSKGWHMDSVSSWWGIAGCAVSFTWHTWIDVRRCMQMIPAGRRASVTVVHFRRHRWRCSRRKGCCCGASIDGRNYAQAADHLSSDTIVGVHCSLPARNPEHPLPLPFTLDGVLHIDASFPHPCVASFYCHSSYNSHKMFTHVLLVRTSFHSNQPTLSALYQTFI